MIHNSMQAIIMIRAARDIPAHHYLGRNLSLIVVIALEATPILLPHFAAAVRDAPKCKESFISFHFQFIKLIELKCYGKTKSIIF